MRLYGLPHNTRILMILPHPVPICRIPHAHTIHLDFLWKIHARIEIGITFIILQTNYYRRSYHHHPFKPLGSCLGSSGPKKRCWNGHNNWKILFNKPAAPTHTPWASQPTTYLSITAIIVSPSQFGIPQSFCQSNPYMSETTEEASYRHPFLLFSKPFRHKPVGEGSSIFYKVRLRAQQRGTDSLKDGCCA